MKTDVFYWLLNAGIFSSVIGAALLLLRRIKRIPRRVIYALWALPLLRFWMPFGISSRFSLLSLISKYATKTVMLPETTDISSTNSIQAAETYFPITYKTNLLESIFSVSTLVWLIGFCALMLTGILLHLFTQLEMRSVRHLRGNVYVSEHVTSPMLYGIIKPKVMIPSFMEHQELRYILMHENMHAKRKDNLFRCIALLTAALHWYNPLVWLFLKKYFEDLELACDESVIAALPDESRKQYALELVNASQARSAFVSAFGGAKIRVRVEKILSYRALSVTSAILLMLFIAAVAVAFLTNAVA